MVEAPGRNPCGAARRSLGFSLVELVVVIVITGIIASVVGLFITGPILGFLDTARRAELVDGAQLALTRMGRDLRGALPNSVRVSGSAVELLLALDGDRYRVESPGGDDDRLRFDVADDSFNTFAQLGAGQTLPGGLRLAVYPLGQAGANPYSDNVLTPSTTTVTVGTGTSTVGGTTEYRVGMSPAHRFPFDSPTRRVFLVEGPVTYECDPPQLLRHSGYAISAPPTSGTSTVIVGNVQSCVFAYAPGTAQRTGVVSLALSMANPDVPDERVRLIRQIHVSNTP